VERELQKQIFCRLSFCDRKQDVGNKRQSKDGRLYVAFFLHIDDSHPSHINLMQ
jgi:hypothetical protein